MSNESNRKRKQKFTIKPIKVSEQDAASTRGVLGRMMGRLPMEREGIEHNRLPESSSLPEISLPKTSLPKTNSLPPEESLGYSKNSLPESGRLPEKINLLASLPDTKGFTKLWHQMTDHLYQQLTTSEQAVHIQLFRLSWGRGEPSCIIGLPRLSERTGIAKSAVQRALKGLEAKGLIEKKRHIFGKNTTQGIEYEVLPPPAMLKSGSLPDSGSLPESGTIKEKNIKNDIKGESAPPDYKNCPDCQGSGFWYPEGTEKGVAKCAHQKLRSA